MIRNRRGAFSTRKLSESFRRLSGFPRSKTFFLLRTTCWKNRSVCSLVLIITDRNEKVEELFVCEEENTKPNIHFCNVNKELEIED